MLLFQSAADPVAVNSNGIKALLTNGWRTFFVNSKQFLVFYHEIHLILFWVFDSLILANKLFAKSLRRFETCLFVLEN